MSEQTRAAPGLPRPAPPVRRWRRVRVWWDNTPAAGRVFDRIPPRRWARVIRRPR